MYPPHCTLTSFFSPKEIKEGVNCEEAFSQAIELTKKLPRDVKISQLVQGKGFHSLKIDSEFLRKFTDIFAKSIELPQNKNQKGIAERYHITLAQHKFNDEINNVFKEKQNILMEDIKKNNLLDKANWSLCLYKKENNELKLCKEVRVA